MADISVILPFVPACELLGAVAVASWRVRRAALDHYKRFFVSWRDEAICKLNNELARAAEELCHDALEKAMEQMHAALSVQDVAQAYREFCNAGLDSSPWLRIVQQARLLKSCFRDIIVRWVCIDVGVRERDLFNDCLDAMFPERDPEVRADLHNAYWQNMRRHALLRHGWKSQGQITAQRRGYARRVVRRRNLRSAENSLRLDTQLDLPLDAQLDRYWTPQWTPIGHPIGNPLDAQLDRYWNPMDLARVAPHPDPHAEVRASEQFYFVI